MKRFIKIIKEKTMNDFIKNCIRTESTKFCNLEDGEGKDYNKERLIHAAMGMQTESSEFTDALKKAIFYGKTLDVPNLKEELGDLLWYVSIAMDELGTSYEQEMARVNKKLKARYPEKFTTEKAINRDLQKERKILEEN